MAANLYSFMDKNILLITQNNIRSGKLTALIPEFYNLKSVVENNDWHHKENVFDHTLSVLKNLDKTLLNLNKGTKQFLNEKVGTINRKNLLRVATLFHDIAKKETLVKNINSTLCPNHESKGSLKTKEILKRFNLSDKENKFILSIVKNHGLIHRILPPENQNFRKEFANFKKRFFHNIYSELILLAFADTAGSYLKKTHPAEFKSRISFYKKEINNLPPNPASSVRIFANRHRQQ